MENTRQRTQRINIRLTTEEFAAVDRQRQACGNRSRADFVRSRLTADGPVPAVELVTEMHRLTLALKSAQPELYTEGLALLRQALDAVVRK